AGFGPLDAADSRAVAAALARDPATKWCVTVTGPDGRAAAHGCAKAGPGRPPPGPGTPAGDPRQSPTGPSSPAGSPRQPPADPSAPAGSPSRAPPDPADPGVGPRPPPPSSFCAWLTSITLAWLEKDGCSHRRESPGYRPSPSLTHLIRARQV